MTAQLNIQKNTLLLLKSKDIKKAIAKQFDAWDDTKP
tara:strand:+ start:5317 stop:5427 length:111 start_codon:yes stop_codon:yes gene_type:complete